jgi:hypothetical protein
MNYKFLNNLFKIKKQIENIQNFFMKIHDYDSEETDLDDSDYETNVKRITDDLIIDMEDIQALNKIINKIDEKIYLYCDHEFEEDEIDITIDESRKIKYCIHCYLDYKNNNKN